MERTFVDLNRETLSIIRSIRMTLEQSNCLDSEKESLKKALKQLRCAQKNIVWIAEKEKHGYSTPVIPVCEKMAAKVK